MPFSPEHKARTRARIVAAASRLFRRHGYSQTGVDELMGEAGLTRGGFYAHFRDKRHLFVEALDHAFDDSFENLFARGLENEWGAAWLRAASRRYLNPKHRKDPGMGCAVPTLGTEVARDGRYVKGVFGRRMNELIERIAERLNGDRELATVLMTSWVGAMVLARAMPRVAAAERVLEVVRNHWERVADDLEAAQSSD